MIVSVLHRLDQQARRAPCVVSVITARRPDTPSVCTVRAVGLISYVESPPFSPVTLPYAHVSIQGEREGGGGLPWEGFNVAMETPSSSGAP